MKAPVQIAMVVVLLGSWLGCADSGWAQTSGKTGTASPAKLPKSAPAAAPDAALSDLLAKLQSSAQQSDSDLGRLRVEKWKADGATRQQGQESVASIQRNLTAAIPELLQQVRAEPDSVAPSFRLYRDLNALYETFSALAESAGAFGPAEQYSPLAADLAQFDRLRHQFADRLDGLVESSDAERLRLRVQFAAVVAKAPGKAAPASSKIVVDDTRPVAKKPKPAAAAKKPAATPTAKPSAAQP